MEETSERKRWYLQENRDLIWDIDDFQKKHMALEFVLKFECRLCVYSPGLSQLYGTYTINVTGVRSETLVVLPEIYGTEKFIGVNEESIKPTGIYIHPGWLFNLDYNHMMTIPIKHRGRFMRSRPIPLAQGFAMVNNQLRRSQFLPVLVNGSLREYRRTAPFLHLYRVDLEALNRSRFHKEQIREIIGKKLTNILPINNNDAAELYEVNNNDKR
ncbi:hypothetical protein [Microbulbifer epialgicus]|uniref:Uncharacterized protein n=1 Tax=Microbulbifer epialgicus TaxID=393907 RepID=A0ABV4NTI0_9GAMM